MCVSSNTTNVCSSHVLALGNIRFSIPGLNLKYPYPVYKNWYSNTDLKLAYFFGKVNLKRTRVSDLIIRYMGPVFVSLISLILYTFFLSLSSARHSCRFSVKATVIIQKP